MAEPVKNVFNVETIRLMAFHLRRVENSFPKQDFIDQAANGLDALGLKERSRQITAALKAALPEDFQQACGLMLEALSPASTSARPETAMSRSGIGGWAVMPMADFVALRGQDHFDRSMETLREFTMRFSSEFAIRPFLAQDTEKALKHVSGWTRDENVHVRRLCSEGTRPRLPWGMRLQAFVKDPTPILPILKALKNDPEEYVRRSVANNLNDIAKDHPELVAGIAQDWLADADKHARRLIRHACRSLIKQGHKDALEALGYSRAKIDFQALEMLTPHVRLGGSVEFRITMASESPQPQALIIDYIVHHRRANGSTSGKVFKWKNIELPGGQAITLTKTHKVRPVTTRSCHAGRHDVEIQINGQRFGRASFELAL